VKTSQTLCLLLVAIILLGGLVSTIQAEPENQQQQRQSLHDAAQKGNYKDAYEGLRKLVLDPKVDPMKVGADLDKAIYCLQRLNRVNEMDAFREAAVEVHKDNWRLLQTVANSYMNGQHHGYIIAGEFQRGNHRGGGRLVNSVQRDRVRALQLMQQAMPMAIEDDDRTAVAAFHQNLANILLNNRGYNEAWRLQYKTDLDELPDYDQGWGFHRQSAGAPVDADGNPVFHHVPKSYDDGETDGQRWRWCLQQAIEYQPSLRDQIEMSFADFLRNQFGVQTMARFGWRFGRMQTDDTKKDESGTYELHTLGEDETICKLASGVKRLTLPEEFNFVKVYRKIAERNKDKHQQSLTRLAQLFEDRRQYPKAAEYWRKAAKLNHNYAHRVQQIVGDWGRFEPIMTQPAGKGATVEYRFRNGKSLELTAQKIKVKQLLDDVKAYLKSNPGRVDWNKVNIGNLGYELVHRDKKKYVGEQVAKWKMQLDPRENHFDRRVTVTTPLQDAGAYLLTAKMADGNTSYIIIWLADTAIVRKPLPEKMYYFVADAASGKPIAKANMEFFGWRQESTRKGRNTPRSYTVLTKNFAEYTDADGQLLIGDSEVPRNYQWLITATTPSGRFAYLGFTGVWYSRRHDPEYNATKTFTITDRPVYRPDQTVKYKFWVRHAQYDKDDVSQFAGQSTTIRIHSPKGEELLKKDVKLDEFGGVEGEWKLPADAMLGVYRLNCSHGGGNTFRVEEYKKPEFEVTVDAPDEPVMLGEKIEAKINAKYYFGSPVTNATVKYKIFRTSRTETWYPWGPWDWFYGPGYWWFGCDYSWYPGWKAWGCRRPTPMWWPVRRDPPELVADNEVKIGEDGTVKVEIDTAVAKAVHPDTDHEYSITAEVVDQSRRTIVGKGKVLVARKPFKVTAWVDRGFYRTGDTIGASFNARTIDGKPVTGKGDLKLYKISYKDGKPMKLAVGSWKLDTDAEGNAHQQIAASEAGQYRLSYKLTDSKQHTIEGGYVFTIIGEGFDGREFRFNDVEIIPQKAEYAPGDKVTLQINTNRTGGTVLLFTRPTSGVYLKPEVIRLDGKSAVREVTVVKKDMPNFFVEAVTVAGGRVHSESREIVVPPEKRVLNVEVLPSAKDYKPGQKAKVKIKLTDFFGEPFAGSTVVSIYDKSVEYISGGSNVPEIKEFFWKWRRHHRPRTETNLGRYFHNITPPNKPGMNNLGAFGASVADDMDSLEKDKEGGLLPSDAQSGGRGGFGGGMGCARGCAKCCADCCDGAPAADAPCEAAAAPMAKNGKGGPGGGGGQAAAQPAIRTKFADTALWVGALKTGKDGTAEVELDMPENLTAWKIKVWGMGHGTKVGQGETEVVTRKDLIIRMQAPRFFVQTDEVVLSANVHNYLKSTKTVNVELALGGKCLAQIGAGSDGAALKTVKIKPGGEARVDWRVKVLDEGQATITMKAIADEDSDAMQMTFPCYIHGMLKMDSYSGSLRPKDTAGKITVSVPQKRRPEQSRLEVRYSPTLAGAMVDALPYMVNYPYGCTEQTLNRFLPTVMTQKILIDMGLNLEDIKNKRTNLNAQEIGEDTERAKRWKRYDRNPVFDEAEVSKMVKDGVKRLTEMQLSDGGWGWFSGYGERSYPHTTAYVVHGLQMAKVNDVALVPGMLERGVAWLKRYQEQEVQELKNWPKGTLPRKQFADNIDAFVYMVLVDADINNTEMRDFLFRDRTKLAVYALSMYGIALQKTAAEEKLDMVMQNISQFVVEDDENQTAWLNLPGGYWWYWYGSEYEAHAYFLKLLSKTDPKGELAPKLVKYLLNNRKHATYWNSTRDTAVCIEAMADFIRASGEDKPEMTVEVWLDGKLQKAVEITSKNLFMFDNKFVIEGENIDAGQHTVELRKKGTGPLYYNAYMTNFTLEDFITKAGLEIKVNRKYYKLNKADKSIKVAGSRGQVVDQKVEKYVRQELVNLSTLKSGDLVEIELEIDSKNDYEYLIFEDMKPAGFEPVDLRSGYTGNDMGAYMEFRDNRVVFFVNRLARGKHSVSYRMRAEIPGKFSALPTRAAAMYAPELKANSDEIKLKVED